MTVANGSEYGATRETYARGWDPDDVSLLSAWHYPIKPNAYKPGVDFRLNGTERSRSPAPALTGDDGLLR